MSTIVVKFEEFRYNSIPMSMCASGDIFQSKLYEIICDINIVKTYINYIVVLRKDKFPTNIELLRVIFHRVCNAGLEFNDKNTVWV